jgi:hypothetical protein
MDDQQEQPDSGDPIPRLDELGIEELLSEKTAFANAMRRILEGLGPDANYAAHGSSPITE